MKELEDVITYPMEQEDWVKTVIIGGVLIFLSFLIVPMFLVYGYLVRTIRGSLGDETEPPVFDEWGSLFVEGIQAWVIGLIYLIIPIIVMFMTVGTAVIAFATGTESGAAAGFGSLFFGLGITALLALIFGYVAVAGIVNFAREERFGAAFDIATLQQVLLNREFAIAFLVAIVIFIVASFVNAIPLIGWLLSPFVGFYAAIVAADLWADGFVAALAEA
ncbi:MAG: DUF4013 domain-containing protein [Halobacteriota archaeon]